MPTSSATAAVRLPSTIAALNSLTFFIVPPLVSSVAYGRSFPSDPVKSSGSAQKDKRLDEELSSISDLCVLVATVPDSLHEADKPAEIGRRFKAPPRPSRFCRRLVMGV